MSCVARLVDKTGSGSAPATRCGHGLGSVTRTVTQSVMPAEEDRAYVRDKEPAHAARQENRGDNRENRGQKTGKPGTYAFIGSRHLFDYRDDIPRTARDSVGSMWYHALNRGNRREAVFDKPGDYDAFVEAMVDARARLPVDLLGHCLMPNHFHLGLRPHHDGDLGRWMQWLLTTHAQRYHRHYGTRGHVWQQRFEVFPVQDANHLVTVLRYVERNALRAELVSRAEDWKWSSLPGWRRGDPLLWKGEEPVRNEQ
jgi:putative transposase